MCIDEAHSNLHTIGGMYAPFAALIRDDGYDPKPLNALTAGALGECGALVVANAISQANSGDRAFPHSSAFTKAELDTVEAWIASGGALLLVADHSPWSGAVADLGLILGVSMLDAYAAAGGGSPGVLTVFGSPNLPENTWQKYAEDRGLNFARFRRILSNFGSLGNHPIVRGRNEAERVQWVVTFTGHAFHPSSRVQPLLIFGQEAEAGVDRREGAMFRIGGWLQAGAIRLGKGRVVVLGEATSCTAQIGGARNITTGMNTLIAPYNARFCLNIMHWLTGLLDDTPR